MKLIKYILPFFIVFLIFLFILDKGFFQAYDYEKLKLQREKFAAEVTEDDPIVIGVVWPLKEAEKEFVGDNFKEGIEFAVDKLNSNGGLLNRKIEVIFKDDEMEAKNSVSIAKDFASNKEVVAVIGEAFSNSARLSSIVYDYSGIVMILPSASDPLLTRDDFNYIFRTIPNDVDVGKAMSKVCKLQNFLKVAVLYENSLYATVVASVFIKNAIELGIEVIYKANFDKDEKFFTEIATNLSPMTNYSVDYDALVAIGHDKSVPLLIKSLRDKGVYSPFVTSDMLDLKDILSKGDFLNNTIVATTFNSEALNEMTQNFIEKFKKRYGFYPDTWAAHGYDAVMLLAEAIKRSNGTNTLNIAKNLKYIQNFKSIFGTYSMTPRGDVNGKDVYFKIIKNGKFKYLN